MELIIGGAFQGKLEYAVKRYGLTYEDVCDLALGVPVPGKRCYRHLEALSRREDVTPYLPLFRDAVVITREVNGGIVPMDVQEEIEWLEGQNRRIDNQASMATLYVTINEKSSAVAAKQPLLTRMGEEFIEGMENFGEFVFGAVLGLIYALPWAAVAAVVIALARRWVRKKKKQ